MQSSDREGLGSRKGFSTSGKIAIITVVLLSGVIIASIGDKMTGQTKQNYEKVQKEFDKFGRDIVLSEQPRLAKEQLKATNYLVTTRSIHCAILQNILYNSTTENMGGSENMVLNGSDNQNVKYLSFVFTLDEKSVSQMECRGKNTIYRATGLNKYTERIKELYDCGSDIDACFYNRIKSSTEEALEEFGKATWGSAPVINQYFDYSDPPPCFICKNPVNDQPGRYGNVKFEYPGNDSLKTDEQLPIVIDAGEEYTKPQEQVPVAKWIDSEGINDNDVPNNWNAWSGPDSHPYWTGDENFAPDPEIARFTRKGAHVLEDEDNPSRENAPYDVPKYNADNAADPPNNCNEFPIKPYSTAMDDVPILVNDQNPLYERTISSDGEIYNYPLVENVKLGFQTCRGSRGQLPNVEDVTDEVSLHHDYEFVICPDSEGRIQSNAALPYHTQKAIHPEDWKGVEKWKPYNSNGNNKFHPGETAGENTVYPFIQLEGSMYENAWCLREKNFVETPGGNVNKQEWVAVNG